MPPQNTEDKQMRSTVSKSGSNTILASDPVSTTSRLSYPSNDYQNNQPRGIAQQGSVSGIEIPLQFPSNPVYFTTAFNPNDQFQSPNYQQHPQPNQVPGFSSQYGTPGTSNAINSSQNNKQLLPQLNFPTNSSSSTTIQSSPFPNATPSSSLSSSSSSYYPSYSQSFQPPPEIFYQQNRSNSYGGEFYTQFNRYSDPQNSPYHSSQQQPYSQQMPHQQHEQAQQHHNHQLSERTQHKPEIFTEDDLRVLKSLLFNGERIKWRYVSSKLSSVSGRRATAIACSKKTRELFKLPSEKAAGSLGTSLPYVVHNAWGDIVEEDA